MSNRTARRCRCRRLLPALLLVCLACMAPAMAGSSRSSSTATAPVISATPTTDAGWAMLEEILSNEAQRIVETMPLIDGQKMHGPIKVKIDPIEKKMTLLLSKDYLADGTGAAFEDIVSYVGSAIVSTAAPAIELNGWDTLVEGRPLSYYFPEDYARASLRSSSSANSSVAVFGGHGWYYHYNFKDWRAQRDPSNGILEDEITTEYSRRLEKMLRDSYRAQVFEPRGHSTDIHTPSGQPWWRLATRYWLKRALPNRPDIWHSLPGSASPLRERNEDIRSRPLYANEVKADTTIHLHTNAHIDTRTRGTGVLYHAGRSRDENLARNILCYMDEYIHIRSAYKDWIVPANPTPRMDLGENKLADMPSVIVELGFHTNPDDARALQDAVFQEGATAGIAKGWYLYTQGMGCKKMKILHIPDVEALYGEHQQIKVEYEGIPLSMIQVISSIKNCPANAPCRGFNGGGPKDGPVTLDISCPIPDLKEPLVLDVETKLMDFSGGSAPLYHHKVKCMPGGAEGPGPWRGLARRR
ncbi:N-acetylmuramoyl-L-alanine amidase [Stenotrophomonas sp. C3(2023)]|uniref:N-acetylmuramoyl-L-alanine amidase family protein n=1 Tax=Stenotrophomonas sp. C3(2023) TaxID=3080277 RepID=UPI00293CAF72|nr:N-acetylmuramoyl-L-alanine amidase [Stenotrophomonas sp. C3(2023)]MDV3467656.1 N-acetylmuramoyl-L-alanine amidase [Stenotrophomonas sp. C3(2023)]